MQISMDSCLLYTVFKDQQSQWNSTTLWVYAVNLSQTGSLVGSIKGGTCVDLHLAGVERVVVARGGVVVRVEV